MIPLDKNPFQNPVLPDGRVVVPGSGRVRDPEPVEDRAAAGPTTDDARCGVCGAVIPPRSIKPGPLRCPAHRADALVTFTLYRAPTTAPEPEAPRPAPAPPAPPITREYVIEVAWKNGVLNRLVEYLKIEGDRLGPRLDDEQAMALAKEIVVDFGVTYGEMSSREIMTPVIEPGAAAADERLGMGLQPSGRRVRGQRRKLTAADLYIPPRMRAADARLAAAVKERAADRGRQRRAVQALAATANEPRREKAAALVAAGLTKAEAARRLGVSRQAIEKLIFKKSRG